MNKQEKIESVRCGEYAWRNDGKLKQLKEVLKITWPKDEFITGGTNKFYYRDKSDLGCCDSNNTTTLPTHSVKEFFNKGESEKKETSEVDKLILEFLKGGQPPLPNSKRILSALKEFSDRLTDEEKKQMFGNEA